MTQQDFEAFAEDMIHKYGPRSVVETMKRAKMCLAIGDERNAEIWMVITSRVRELQRQG
jgi:hypothetical protein